MANLDDILFLALEKTGVETIPTSELSLTDPTTILSAAAGSIINDSLLSADINDLTAGFLSSISKTAPATTSTSSSASSAGAAGREDRNSTSGAGDLGLRGATAAAVDFGNRLQTQQTHVVQPSNTNGPSMLLSNSINSRHGLPTAIIQPNNMNTAFTNSSGVQTRPTVHVSVPNNRVQNNRDVCVPVTAASSGVYLGGGIDNFKTEEGLDLDDLDIINLFEDDSIASAATQNVPASSLLLASDPGMIRSGGVPSSMNVRQGQQFPFDPSLLAADQRQQQKVSDSDQLSALLDATSTNCFHSEINNTETNFYSNKGSSVLNLSTVKVEPPYSSSTPGYRGSNSSFTNFSFDLPLDAGHMSQASGPPNRTLVYRTAVAAQPNLQRPSTGTEDIKQTYDEEVEEDETSTGETYANYRPAKLKLGKVHPDPVVESSSLSSVEPPQVWFDLKLPGEVVQEAWLSSLQLEAIVYASQQHMNILADGARAGYLVGDGAGVGKGRTIAGIIYQNYLEGRKKSLWLSVSNDLRWDAMRDLRDVGAKKIDVFSLSKFHYGKISGKRNGRVRKGVIFATYSSLIGESSSGGKYRTRFNQLLHWLGPHFEGVIVFDECHKAKNLVPSGSGRPSKTGLTVLQLQKKLPKARVVYCSATGASEPRNMAYMSRLGMWGPGTQFPVFNDFIKAVERRGVGAMEIVAMDMKLRGMYTARQLSFSGVAFDVKEVSLSEEFIEMYDASVELWVEARKLFQEAASLMDLDSKQLKTMWGQFWSSHQRFFKYLCIAAKVPEVIKCAKKSLQDGKCVVIGLQSTGEARTLEQLEQNAGVLSDFVSTCKGVLQTLIQRHFPAAPTSATRMGIDWSVFDDDPTLPGNRKRKRAKSTKKRELTFEDEEFSSDSSDDSTGSCDSAVESSSDEGEDPNSSDDNEEKVGPGGGGGGGGGRKGGRQSSSDDDEDSDGGTEDFNPFGSDEPWLKQSKPKAKRRKVSSKKKGNFSIKAPPTSSDKRCKKTKTGFNSKSLKFEPVTLQSPTELKQPKTAATGNSSSGSGPGPLAGERRNSLQASMSTVGGGSMILDLMSTSAQSTGSHSSLRNVTVRKMKEELLGKLEVLGPHLPSNTLDELIEGLGGPSRVAEMTGRKGRVVTMPNGSIQYQLRSESDVSLEMLNIAEKQRFMDGEKNIAIISEAASQGISLQADRRVKNQKRRVHITLELPWSADKAIQQFGRTHRSNQVSAPEYLFLISELAGEQRFASTVAKRLQSLGALTHGDRRATEGRDLSKYNLDNKYSRTALETVLRSILGTEKPLVKSEDYNDEFFDKCRSALTSVDLLTKPEHGPLVVEKDAANMTRFLNRILGLPTKLQNKMFAYFTETVVAIVQQAKRMGRWDSGILDYGASGEQVEIVQSREFLGDAVFGTATTQLHKVFVERGLTFAKAMELLNTDFCPGEGFYVSKNVRNGKQMAVLLKVSEPSSKIYLIYRPNIGLQSKMEKFSDLLKRYVKADEETAEKCWVHQYAQSFDVCSHAFWQGKCRQRLAGEHCDIGLRRRTIHLLAGSVLGVWTHLEAVFSRHKGHSNRMQIARVKSLDRKLVGILIPPTCVNDLVQTLERIDKQATEPQVPSSLPSDSGAMQQTASTTTVTTAPGPR